MAIFKKFGAIDIELERDIAMREASKPNKRIQVLRDPEFAGNVNRRVQKLEDSVYSIGSKYSRSSFLGMR
jgi:hypothetical protein